MFRWIPETLDTIGGFVNRHQLLVTFGIPAVGILLTPLFSLLGGNTGVRILCSILLPLILILLAGCLWHQAHHSPGDDS